MRISITLDMDEAFVVNEALAAYRDTAVLATLKANMDGQSLVAEHNTRRNRTAKHVQDALVVATERQMEPLRAALGMVR